MEVGSSEMTIQCQLLLRSLTLGHSVPHESVMQIIGWQFESWVTYLMYKQYSITATLLLR